MRLWRSGFFLALALASLAAHARANIDRKTCVVGVGAYPKVYEAVMASWPKDVAIGYIMAEGRRAGLDMERLAQQAPKLVDILYEAPTVLLPAPDVVLAERDNYCSRYPESSAP